MEWKNLNPALSQQTLASLKELGFTHTTPVQATCIPLFMSNKDVAAEAVTGSGKTLAFVIPIIECLLKREEALKKYQVGAIIITPTRELAIQIDEVLTEFAQNTGISKILLVGGCSIDTNVSKFEESGGNIVTATPGRLVDLFSRRSPTFDLKTFVKSLEILVLDEADRLLDLGFEKSINAILSYLPKQRRTGLFSATQTEEVEALIRAGLRNPVRIVVKEKSDGSETSEKRTPDTLDNYYMICESDKKFNQLVAFLKLRENGKHVLFLSTCACVDYFSRILPKFLKKIVIIGIHGKMKKKRSKLFDDFRKRESGLLICTDVMARGVDIPEVHWVIQYDPPSNASAFIHRCGRTARIGKEGSAIAFLLPAEETYVEFVSLNQKVPLQRREKQEDVPDLIPKLKKFVSKDRDIYKKSVRAFVSFIQSYRKHECNLIFRLKDLDIAKLANGFGLLRLPSMPEIKLKNVQGFKPMDVDVDKIPYRDKAREKQRQAQAVAQKAKEQENSESVKRKPGVKRQLEQQGKHNKKGRKAKSAKSFYQDDYDTMEDDYEFSREIALMKKLKKGKITEEEFNERVNDDLE